ncbi:MAG: polysaccharide biosynthesis tyrosine autokinase [Flavobacteriales bacterium]|nr:polysaccharide biosynthesis tyrosine autokinase [Flavobacteriales bacterium]
MQQDKNFDEYKERLTNFSYEFDLGLFIHILKKSLPWMVTMIVVALVTGFLYLRYTPETYQAKAILQLGEDDSANRVLNVNTLTEDNSIDGRVELIRSKLLIQKTLENMPVEISYFAKGEILTNEHYILSPYRVEIDSIWNDRFINRTMVMEFDQDLNFDLLVGGEKYSGSPGKPVSFDGMVLNVVIVNEKALRASIEEYELYFRLNNTKTLANRFAGGLDIRILNNTAKTVQISYKDNNPYLAKDFVSALSSEFIRFDLEKRQRSDENILNFIDAQIDTVFERLKNSEILLNQYKQSNKITDLQSISGVYLNRLTDLETRVIQLEVEEKLLNEVESLTQKSSTEIEIYNLVPLVAGSQYESALSGLLETLERLLLAKEEALFRVTEENNKVQSLEYQIGIQKEIIVKTIDAMREKIGARKDELYAQLKEIEEVYYDLPTKELEFARLERLFNINEKYYTMLLEKRIEYRISKEGFVTQNQILEEARLPQTPIAPKRNLILISFFLAGLLLSFIFISVRYLLHNEITSLNEVVRLSNASISTLGVIPKYKENVPVSMLLVDRNPKSLIAESFRTIRTNMQFLNNEDGPKIAAVTSTISGEGKTFIALNLAGIIAFSGKRVVVIDLDMRKPKIHKGFEVDNDRGMSTILIGRTSIEECIRNSQLDNLDFITAGPIPPNPSELIISKKMDEVIESLMKEYDMVIIDTPPVGLVTDGIAIINKADFPLYIFRSDYSKKKFIQNVDRLINENQISKLSVILNGVDFDRNKYAYNYGYGYGYGYGTGYGYGYYDEKQPKKKGILKPRKK